MNKRIFREPLENQTNVEPKRPKNTHLETENSMANTIVFFKTNS